MTARRNAAKQTRSYTAKAVPENDSAASQSYFRATGFNVSLKTLAFEGNYAAPTAQQPATAIPNDRKQSEQNGDPPRIRGVGARKWWSAGGSGCDSGDTA